MPAISLNYPNAASPRSAVALFLCALFAFTGISIQAQSEAEKPDIVSIFNEAQNLHAKGDLVGAIKLYDEAIKIEPAFPEAEYQRGVAELALGNHAAAEKSFRRAVELRPDWTLAMTGLGSLLVEKNELVDAEKLLTKVVDLEPHNSVALSALADLYLRRNAPAEVLQTLLVKIEGLTLKANANASLWTARAALENRLGRPTATKASLAKALAVEPKNRSALFLLGEISLADGDIVKAKDIVSRLDDGSPASDLLRLLRANIYAIEGKAGEALVQLDAIKTENAEATELRAKIGVSRTTNAADLQRQLDKDEKNPTILGRLCALFRKENPQKALEYCRRASESEPGNINHAVGFGAALVQAKQYEAAAGIFRKILKIVPENATAHANLATALFQLKRFPEAKSEFQWLRNDQPMSAGAYLFLGILHDDADELMDAMANYQQYLKFADPVENKIDIEKVNLRLPSLQKAIKDGKGRKPLR